MTQRLGFFLFVLVFAGSVVLIAAHDLRRHSIHDEKGNAEDGKLLMKALAGNPLSKVGSPEVIEADMIPQRGKGQYLVESDKKTLNQALKQIVPRPAEEQ